jgi:hypothetical protein
MYFQLLCVVNDVIVLEFIPLFFEYSELLIIWANEGDKTHE